MAVEEGAENTATEQKNECDQAVEAQGDGKVVEGVAESLERELAEARERYLRLMADFENFKKRTMKEQSEMLKYQGERVIVDLLEVLDNLELALAHSSAEYEKLKQGLEMVHKMFVERLERWGIRGESGMGHEFDPHRHAAISRVPSATEKPGTIVGELKKPYFYNGKLIRVGEVVVAGSDAVASSAEN